MPPLLRAAHRPAFQREQNDRSHKNLPSPTSRSRAAFSRPDWLWLGFRIKLVAFELGTLALGAFALTRGRTRVYFEAMAKAAEGAEEP